MKLLINYANDLFHKSQQRNSKSGLKTGLFDKVNAYTPQDIDPEFYRKNQKILEQKRGNGYWLWKPYFIKKALETLSDGDFLFYCDAGAYFIGPIAPLVDISLTTGQKIITFDLEHAEKQWTKRDAFILMDCDNPQYTDTPQRLASFSLWRKADDTMAFAADYLAYAEDERLITDLENQCGQPNYPGFREHRHDQSIFSLLAKRHGLEAYRDPSQWGNDVRERYPNSPYPQLIEHTRKKGGPVLGKLLRKAGINVDR